MSKKLNNLIHEIGRGIEVENIKIEQLLFNNDNIYLKIEKELKEIILEYNLIIQLLHFLKVVISIVLKNIEKLDLSNILINTQLGINGIYYNGVDLILKHNSENIVLSANNILNCLLLVEKLILKIKIINNDTINNNGDILLEDELNGEFDGELIFLIENKKRIRRKKVEKNEIGVIFGKCKQDNNLLIGDFSEEVNYTLIDIKKILKKKINLTLNITYLSQNQFKFEFKKSKGVF